MGLSLGLVYAQAAGRYWIARILFARNDQKVFARDPALFMDWARDAALLRVTGDAYQFQHEDYRLWLLKHRDAPAN